MKLDLKSRLNFSENENFDIFCVLGEFRAFFFTNRFDEVARIVLLKSAHLVACIIISSRSSNSSSSSSRSSSSSKCCFLKKNC
jgi:hypothetical protein